MMIEHNTEGITPTAEHISNLHTGKFVKILPDTYIIKGAVNDRGFDQGYALSNNKRKDLLLIDVVEEATKEAVQTIVNDGYNIKAILISGETVLNEAYADLETLSKDAGGADIYLHPDIASKGSETKPLTTRDALLSSFHLEPEALPSKKTSAVTLYSSKNDGMLFTGDAANGSKYDSDNFLFTRDKMPKEDDEFNITEFWKNYGKEFRYLFPRKGKPALDVDDRTRTTLLDRLSRKSS